MFFINIKMEVFVKMKLILLNLFIYVNNYTVTLGIPGEGL